MFKLVRIYANGRERTIHGKLTKELADEWMEMLAQHECPGWTHEVRKI